MHRQNVLGPSQLRPLLACARDRANLVLLATMNERRLTFGEGAAAVATALARLGWEVTESVPDAAGGPATTLVDSATRSIEIGWERKRVLSVLASAEAEALIIAEPRLAGASATPVRDVQALSFLVETDPKLSSAFCAGARNSPTRS